MIENLGDPDFPVDTCDFGNCGARNRADYHKNAAGSLYVLSYCPPGGSHGSRGYADWDAWVLSAVKTILHNQRGVPKFTGYVEPSLAVSNACLTAPLSPSAPTIGTATAGDASIIVNFGAPASDGGAAITGYSATCTSSNGGVSGSNIGGASATSIRVGGLTNGKSYTCTVTASNSVSPGPASAPSNAVTPFDLTPILLLLLD